MKQNQALASGTEETPRPRSPISRLQAAYWRLSLRGKISVPFVSVFLGMWMLGMLSIGYYFSADIEQRQRQEAEAIASLVLQEFEQRRKILRLDAKLLTETEGVRPAVADGNINRLRQKLLPLKTTLSFDLVRVVDSKGNVLIDLRRQVLYQAKLYDEILVSQALSAVDLSSIVTVEKPAPSILVGTAPIKSRTGVIGAVIVGNAVSDRLLEQISQGTDKYIAAFNQGKMIASTLPNGTQWQAPPQQGTSRINIGTNSYITKTVILSGLDNAELKLVLLSPLAPLMKAKQNLWITIGLFSLVGVAVATAVGFWVAGAIARPITQVTEATERLASGILTTRLPVISSDELGKLAQGFNSMVEQLSERDRLLHLQMEQLEQTLEKLSSTQAQLVHSEKMSSLGQMVAGIAHEINNPIGFIYSNINHAHNYIQDLYDLLALYQQHYPEPEPEIAELIDDIDLEFLLDDFQKIFSSMKGGSERIRAIVLSLRSFSRLDESESKPVDLHEGIDSTLMILQHQLHASDPKIEVIKEYGNLPMVECYAGQVNQVFLNLLNNAIDALLMENSNQKLPKIWIITAPGTNGVSIKIADNGPGMTEEVVGKVFDPFFTTKPVGKGTGLGLTTSYQIVVEKHGGVLRCSSQLHRGTEFAIELPITIKKNG